ncbi:MAG TPA: tape measure protein [Stellaceae bacterium]|nr:tape measure protein [Stellaceae bacterium]
MGPALKPKSRQASLRKSVAVRRGRTPAGIAAPIKHAGAEKAQLRRLVFALRTLEASGVITGASSRKLSVRIDPGVLDAAAKQLGLANPSDVVNASLALAAAPDRFKVWLRESTDVLPDDFELAV